MEKGSSEIAKLTERISKDPKSKLFVPLAEEYKKAGDIEMAIAVLTEGLKNNPGYVTAKSFLGRLLLDQGKLSEAQEEFEEVIKAIPDNVLAQRKLADIHVLQGRAQEALLFFKAVLAVNPKDPELKALVADIEAGRDVRGKIAGPKYKPAAAQVAAAVPTPGPPPPPPPIKSSLAVPKAVVNKPPFVDAEEPEEVLVFESLDEAAPVVALKQPVSTHDMFADLALESGNEEAVRMDDGLTDGESSRPAEPQPVSGSDADRVSPDRPVAADMGHESGITDAGSGNSFFDSEPAPIDIPAADHDGVDAAVVPDIFLSMPESDPGSLDAGQHDGFFDAEPLPAETAAAENREPEVVPDGGLAEPSFADDGSSEALFFDVEPVETEEEPQASIARESEEELTPVTLEVPVPGQDSFVPEEASPDGVLFDVEPSSGLEGAADIATASFGETVPEADDFTTDTLAELYIAQGFYEKAIEIYERMLADKPNSKLLRDKLANVRAMGSMSGADEEQGTPALFEAPGSPPAPSSQPLSAQGTKYRSAPGVEAEAKEYIPPPADDFEATASGSDFAPVEYVQPEVRGTVPPSTIARELPVQDEEPPPASSKTAALVKEQTIAKLDNWLKNIMKEK
jgi:tetratricopeptide (TPR) repeat protein